MAPTCRVLCHTCPEKGFMHPSNPAALGTPWLWTGFKMVSALSFKSRPSASNRHRLCRLQGGHGFPQCARPVPGIFLPSPWREKPEFSAFNDDGWLYFKKFLARMKEQKNPRQSPAAVKIVCWHLIDFSKLSPTLYRSMSGALLC